MKYLVTVLLLTLAPAVHADTAVALYFTDSEVAIERDCAATLVSNRSYNVSALAPEFVLLELLSGPNAKEQLGGAADSFAPLAGSNNPDSRLVQYLTRTEQQGRRFLIHFGTPALAWFNNGSCGATSVLAPIQTTLTQLSGVDKVEIYIDGQRLQDVTG